MTHLALSECAEVHPEIAVREHVTASDEVAPCGNCENLVSLHDIGSLEDLEVGKEIHDSPHLNQAGESETSPLSLLEELDARQDDVLLQLDDLNSKVEQLIAEFMRVRAAEGEAA